MALMQKPFKYATLDNGEYMFRMAGLRTTEEEIKTLSEEFGVSQSQLYQYFAITGLNNMPAALRALPRYLEKSPAPMWEHSINFERLKEDLGID